MYKDEDECLDVDQENLDVNKEMKRNSSGSSDLKDFTELKKMLMG